MTRIACIALLCLIAFNALSQDNVWNTLGMVTFEKEYDPQFGIETQTPKFHPLVSDLDGSVIEVNGYIIPLKGKVDHTFFMFSKFPQNMCFFCGKAGPESAMMVYLKEGEEVRYNEEKIRVRGKLRINASALGEPLYTLEQAVVMD